MISGRLEVNKFNQYKKRSLATIPKIMCNVINKSHKTKPNQINLNNTKQYNW